MVYTTFTMPLMLMDAKARVKGSLLAYQFIDNNFSVLFGFENIYSENPCFICSLDNQFKSVDEKVTSVVSMEPARIT